MILYTVKKGDSLYKIAKTHHSTIDDIVKVNDLNITNPLIIGQGLFIPSKQSIHIVVPGESLYSIASNYGLTIDQLLSANPYIDKPYVIYPGQQILIKNNYDKKYPLSVNGYIFLNTNSDYYLPNAQELTYLSLFSYRFDIEGNLIALNDNALLERLRNANIDPILTLTNTNEKGTFSTSLLSKLLNNPQLSNRLINQIYQTLKQKQYTGINIDFEYIEPADKEFYLTFLKTLRQKLDFDYELSVALAPKYSSTQKGLLYEAHDYQKIGEIVDRVVIMTYEWGYTYGPALPVAPIKEVEKVIQYAVTQIDPLKINLGIPTYGYDFLEPFKEGNKARSLSYEQAIALAREKNVSIKFDESSKTPYFTYFEPNQKHIVYYEDVRSIKAKIELAIKYKLGGISFWTIRSKFEPLWALINELIDVVKHE